MNANNVELFYLFELSSKIKIVIQLSHSFQEALSIAILNAIVLKIN